MAEPKLHVSDFNPVVTPADTDILSCYQSGDTENKKVTREQIVAAEKSAREAQDNIIEASTGLETDGTVSQLSNSWYLRDADLTTGGTDRGGVFSSLTRNIKNMIRLLDSKLYTIATNLSESWGIGTGTSGVYKGNASNVSTGDYSTVLGFSNDDNGKDSVLMNGKYGTAEVSGSINNNLLIGASLVSDYVFNYGVATTDATLTELSTAGRRIPISTDSHMYIVIDFMSYQTGGTSGSIGDYYAQTTAVFALNNGGAYTVSSQSTLNTAISSTLSCAYQVTNSGGEIVINVTGEANKDIAHSATVRVLKNTIVL